MDIEDSIHSYSAIRNHNGEFKKVQDELVREVRLTVRVNDSPFTTTMCSPGMLEELVFGLLHSEDVFRGDAINTQLEIRKENDSGYNADFRTDKVFLGEGILSGRSLLSVASCGICGKTELEFIRANSLQAEQVVDQAVLTTMLKKMESLQHTWSRSGGSHASSAFSKNGELLAMAEDVGRHNAVDKCVGSLLLDKKLDKAEILLVSSRLSYEIVAKSFTAGIPVLAAVGAPSSLAVDFAKELGVTLLAFCREDRFTIYSHPERITNSPTISVNID